MSNQSISVLALTVQLASTVAANRFVTVTGGYSFPAGNALGVTRTDGVSGDDVPVDVLGTTTVEAGGAITKGSALELGADGVVVARSSGVTVARALADAASGDLVEVFLIAN